MRFRTSSTLSVLASACLVILAVVSLANRASAQLDDDNHRFQVTSSTFANNTTLPSSAILNGCTIDGSVGGDQSPELSWKNAPQRTRSFVIVTYDVTAAYTHWGMYNIPATTTELPENAGVAGSKYGAQIVNDVTGNAEYDGPCPPPDFPPDVHHYVFTVYALDTTLELPGSPNFPPKADTLYHALISAGERRHILATASIVGLYSTTPGN